MGDVLFLLIVVGFFTLAVLYVRACAAVVGPAAETQTSDTGEDLETAA